MIFLKKDIPLKVQIQKDIQELENCKNNYMQKICEYKEGTNDINSLLNEPQCVQMNDTVLKNSKEKIKIYNTQILKIERNLALLNDMLENVDNLNEDELIDNLKNYNKEFIEIKRNIDINIFNSEPNKDDNFQQNIQKNYNVNKETKEEVVGNEMNNVVENEETSGNMNNNLSHIEKSDDINEIQNNDTLLISEILNAVLLPYTAEEVLEILENENETYKTAEEVIIDKFTRPLSDYKFQFWSRYNETIKLLTVRQKYCLSIRNYEEKVFTSSNYQCL